MKNLDYRNLAALDAVVAHGNFEKAALALGVSQSAVSQRVKALEDAAGRLLVVRGQPAVPTGLGQRLIAHFQHVRLMENALEIELGQDITLPVIAVAADADSIGTWFGEACGAMLASPKCRLEMRLNTGTGLAALRDGSVFGCVSSAQESVSGASATALGLLRYVLVATPRFARQWFPHGCTLEAAVSAHQMSSGSTSSDQRTRDFIARSAASHSFRNACSAGRERRLDQQLGAVDIVHARHGHRDRVVDRDASVGDGSRAPVRGRRSRWPAPAPRRAAAPGTYRAAARPGGARPAGCRQSGRSRGASTAAVQRMLAVARLDQHFGR
jgi:LysR family transcriptional regulator (chromosome initiation inhibitor)